MLDRYGEPEPEHFDPHAVADCELCDDNGYRGHRVCDHVDYREAARRGMALIRAVFENKQRKEQA